MASTDHSGATTDASSSEPDGGLVQLSASGATRLSRVDRLPRGLERLVGVVVLFAIWELASRVGWLDPKTLAGPSTVLTAGWDLLRDGTLPDAMWASLKRVLFGLASGITIGTVLAVISGVTRPGEDLIDANIQMLRFVPIIALQPLLILWLGIGETVKISMITLGVMFPVYVNTVTAIRSIPPGYRELSMIVGLSRRQYLSKIVLPGALPGFTVGLRLATSIAWLLLVFAEQVNASTGLGFLMNRAQTFFQTDVIVVCLVIYAAMGLISDALVRALEKKVLRWQPGR